MSEGIAYREVALERDGGIDLAAVQRALAGGDGATVFIQRSRGYAPRPSLFVAECERAAEAVKRFAPETLVLVDNCYGELVEEREPSQAGADLVMGSLIKNLGGSLAPAGAYVAGRAELVERVAARLYAPGLGAALGPTLGFGRALCQGLFLAPLVVEQCLRGLDFIAALFEALGFAVDPLPGAPRTDIVQAIRLGTPELLTRFAAGLQAALPVNARFRPVPGAGAGICRSRAHVVGRVRQRRDDRALVRRAAARAVRGLRPGRRQRRARLSRRAVRGARAGLRSSLGAKKTVEVVAAAVRGRDRRRAFVDTAAVTLLPTRPSRTSWAWRNSAVRSPRARPRCQIEKIVDSVVHRYS